MEQKVPIAGCFGPNLDSPIHIGELLYSWGWPRPIHTPALFGACKEITFFLMIFQGCREGRVSLLSFMAHQYILCPSKRFWLFQPLSSLHMYGFCLNLFPNWSIQPFPKLPPCQKRTGRNRLAAILTPWGPCWVSGYKNDSLAMPSKTLISQV